MKILGGVYQPDAGEILSGRPAGQNSTVSTTRCSLGIAFIHQELNVLDNLDVAANVFLGREPQKRAGPDRPQKNPRRHRAVSASGSAWTFPARTRLDQLSIAQQQMVEIAKALSLNARIIIMDEPTSSLTLTETERLLELVCELSEQGVSIIYISHRLGEIEHCADRVVVLRDGKNAGELAEDEATPRQIW